MKELLAELMDLKEKERNIKERRVILEGQIYDSVEKLIDSDKTFNLICDEYKLSVKPNYVVKVDQDMAKEYSDMFKVKYEMSYSQYKKSEHGKIIDEIVTISQNKPTFLVELK
jgi:hypothetical protein